MSANDVPTCSTVHRVRMKSSAKAHTERSPKVPHAALARLARERRRRRKYAEDVEGADEEDECGGARCLLPPAVGAARAHGRRPSLGKVRWKKNVEV